jgi:general secretion pathway protein F
VLLEQQVPLPEALRLAAAGAHDSYLAQGCRRVAAEVEAGRPLAESMAARPQFPPTLVPLVRWGQQTPALADAFRAAAEMFQGRVFSRGGLLEALLLPVALLVIVTMVGFFVLALFLPMTCLIQKLSG